MKIWLFFWLHPQTTDQSLEIETISKAKPYEIRCQIRNLSYPIKWWFARVFSTFGFFKDFQVFFAKLMALTATCNQIVFLCVQPTYLLSQFDLIKIQKTAFTENWNRFCKHIWWRQSLASKWKKSTFVYCNTVPAQYFAKTILEQSGKDGQRSVFILAKVRRAHYLTWVSRNLTCYFLCFSESNSIIVEAKEKW